MSLLFVNEEIYIKFIFVVFPVSSVQSYDSFVFLRHILSTYYICTTVLFQSNVNIE